FPTLPMGKIPEGTLGFGIRVSAADKKPSEEIYYKLSGKRITSDDFASKSLIGKAVVRDDGFAYFYENITADLKTEGDEGFFVDFYSAPPSQSLFPEQENRYEISKYFDISDVSIGNLDVYRLRNYQTGEFLLTANLFEVDSLTGLLSTGPSASSFIWLNEGVAFQNKQDATQAVHRFLNQRTFKHFYSANDAEVASLRGNATSGYAYEGIAFSVYPASALPAKEGMSVLRFYDPTADSHVYSSSIEEQAILSRTYINEGVAWYA
ncbi:hypothetical protein KBZ15_17940, partial [Cyanobium sp. BA20m-p-22]|nr:hypothetical protein [Cyanobium sp. BA20m-p-22]